MFEPSKLLIISVGHYVPAAPYRACASRGRPTVGTISLMGYRPVPPRLLPKRHPKLLQKFPRFVVGPRGRHNRDVHSPDLIDLRVIDFREDQLIAQAQRVISASVE